MYSKLFPILGIALSFATSNAIDLNSMRLLKQKPSDFKEREVDFDLINSVINDNLFGAEEALKKGANPNVKVEFDTCNPVCTSAEFSDQEQLKAQNAYDENFANKIESFMHEHHVDYYNDGRGVPVLCKKYNEDCDGLSYLQSFENEIFGWFVAKNSDSCDQFEKQKRYSEFSWQGRTFTLYLIIGYPEPSYTYPLFLSIKSAEMTKLLIAYGAKIDQKEPAGNTPLQSSIAAGAIDTMHTLISAGANVHERICMGSECGESLLDCALGVLRLCGYPQLKPGLKEMKQTVSELLRLGVSPIYNAPKTPLEALIYAVMIGDQKMVAQYLTPCSHVSVNEISDRHTPLTMAVWLGRYDIAKQLLEFSLTDVNMKDGKDETPLFLAAMRNDLPLVELLLQHGADTKPLLCREIREYEHNNKYSKEVMDLIKRYNASEPCTRDFKKE